MAVRGSAAVMITLVLTMCPLVMAGANPRSATAPGNWHNAIEVPGTAALNKGGAADVTSISCAPAGNCTAAGNYFDASSRYQVFVASEVKGVWHNAVEVPGTAALNANGLANLGAVSCASVGNCGVGGSYYDAAGHSQAFIASEVNGVWHNAIEVPGTAALNKGGLAQVNSVSCASAGNCIAGGDYSSASGSSQAFVASEVNGAWHTAIEVPGTAALDTGGLAQTFSVTCPSAGNCGAGGAYWNTPDHAQAFVVSEVNGTWGTAVQVPGTAGQVAGIGSVSCTSAGNCAAGGSFLGDSMGLSQAFVDNEVNGTWHTAIEVPGTATLNTGASASVISMSCPAAGKCGAGGSYTDSSGKQQAFVVSEG